MGTGDVDCTEGGFSRGSGRWAWMQVPYRAGEFFFGGVSWRWELGGEEGLG